MATERTIHIKTDEILVIKKDGEIIAEVLWCEYRTKELIVAIPEGPNGYDTSWRAKEVIETVRRDFIKLEV